MTAWDVMGTSHWTYPVVDDRVIAMLDEQERCQHLFTHTTRRPMGRRRHGGQYVEHVRCNDCQAVVMVRTFDDPRDDLDRFLPPDGPATRKDSR